MRRKADFPCFVCGGARQKPYFSTGGSDFWRCRKCGLIRMHPLPPLGAAGEDYQGFDLGTYKKFMETFRVPQYERDLAWMRESGARGRLLDVGCGLGEFLDVAVWGGFQAAGVEPSPTASGIAAERHPVVRGELLDADLGGRRFEAVTLWSVLEHVPSPPDVLARVASLLEPGGILALRVPDVRGLLPRLALLIHRLTFGRLSAPVRVLYQLDWHYKHFTGFGRRNLERAVRNAGFEVLGVRREMSYTRRSLDLRMDYVALGGGAAVRLIKPGLGLIGGISRLLGFEDELVLLARRK
jgi:SAM-dependent methyltransferase